MIYNTPQTTKSVRLKAVSQTTEHTLRQREQKPQGHRELVQCFDGDEAGEPWLEFNHELVVEGFEVPGVVIPEDRG